VAGATQEWPKVVGKVELNSEAARRVVEEYLDAVRNAPSSVPTCYEPHYRIRIYSHKEWVDIEISYKCSRSSISGAVDWGANVSPASGTVARGILEGAGVK